MKGFAPLISVYKHVIHHHFVPPRLKTYVPFFSLLSLGVLLLVLEFLGFRRIFRYMAGLQEFPFFFVQVLLERLVGLIFLISYSMIFMSSMINGLSTLYLSANLPFLYSLPISKWKVLTVKFVENWFLSCYLVLLFLICFLFSHAFSFRLPWTHYTASIILLTLFTLSPVAFGSAVVTLLIRFFPVRRIHQLVTLIAGIFLAALMIAVRMMKPELLLNPTDTDDFVRLMQNLTVPSLSHLPSSWASHTIVYGGFVSIFKLFLFGLFSLALLAIVVRLFYDKAFVYSQESRSIRKTPGPSRKAMVKARNKVVAMMIKDTKLFLRDATQWSQLLLLAALVVVYLLNIRNLAIQLPLVRWIVSFINLGLAGFVLAALSVRFLFPSVSMEGRSFWIVKTLPISFRVLLWCKYWIYFPPFLLFAQMLVYASNRILQVEPFFVRLSAANILAVAVALTGLAVGIGALMPDFKADHPSKIAVGPGGLLYMLLSFIYVALMLVIQIRPVWNMVLGTPERVHSSLYYVAAIGLTIVVGFIPMEWGARRLARQEYVA